MDGVCQRCGAMLPPPDLDGVQQCPSCGHTVQHRPADPAPEPGEGAPAGPPPPGGVGWAPPPGSPPPPGRTVGGPAPAGPTTGSRGCSVVLLALVLLAVAGAVVAVLAGTGAVDDLQEAVERLAGGDRTVEDEGVLVLGGEPAAPLDAVALTYRYDQGRGATVHQLVRWSDAGTEPRWVGPSVEDATARLPLAAASGAAVAVDGDQAVAVELATGAERWRTTLSDVVARPCRGCLVVVDGTVVVVPDDAVVQALDLATGEPRWERRLADVRGRVEVVGGAVWVVDSSGGAVSVAVLDPATGAERATVPLSCSVDGATSPSTDVDVELVALPDGDALIGHGTWPGCWERRGPDGALRWQAGDEELWFSFGVPWATDGQVLASGDSEEGLLVIDLATGSQRPIPAPPDAELVPLDAAPDLVLALSATTRGSPRWSVVAYDTATLAPRWTVPLDAGVPLVGDDATSSVVTSNDLRVLLHRDGEVLRAVTVDGADGSVRTGGIVLADGTAAPGGRADLPASSGVTRVGLVGWLGSRVVLVLDGALVELDAGTGEVRSRYGGR